MQTQWTVSIGVLLTVVCVENVLTVVNMETLLAVVISEMELTQLCCFMCIVFVLCVC